VTELVAVPKVLLGGYVSVLTATFLKLEKYLKFREGAAAVGWYSKSWYVNGLVIPLIEKVAAAPEVRVGA
jgi:hypothetical protein